MILWVPGNVIFTHKFLVWKEQEWRNCPRILQGNFFRGLKVGEGWKEEGKWEEKWEENGNRNEEDNYNFKLKMGIPNFLGPRISVPASTFSTDMLKLLDNKMFSDVSFKIGMTKNVKFMHKFFQGILLSTLINFCWWHARRVLASFFQKAMFVNLDLNYRKKIFWIFWSQDFMEDVLQLWILKKHNDYLKLQRNSKRSIFTSICNTLSKKKFLFNTSLKTH